MYKRTETTWIVMTEPNQFPTAAQYGQRWVVPANKVRHVGNQQARKWGLRVADNLGSFIDNGGNSTEDSERLQVWERERT